MAVSALTVLKLAAYVVSSLMSEECVFLSFVVVVVFNHNKKKLYVKTGSNPEELEAKETKDPD